jgi:hypothetical protein
VKDATGFDGLTSRLRISGLIAVATMTALATTSLSDEPQGPHLLYGHLPALRKRFKAPRYAWHRKLILAGARRALEADPRAKRKDLGSIDRLLAGYALTGEKQYREALGQWLATDWDRREPRGFGHHIVGRIALVYDTIGDELTDPERKKILAYLNHAVEDFVAQARMRHWFVLQSFSNTAGVSVSGGGLACLAMLGEHELAAEGVQAAILAAERFCGACIAPDGACVEGVLYWNYGLSNCLEFLHALGNSAPALDAATRRRAKWLLNHPNLKRNVRLLETMLGGDGHLMPFNDSQPYLCGLSIATDLGSRFDQPLMRWYADFLLGQLAKREEDLGLTVRDGSALHAFLWHDGRDAPSFPGLPTLSVLDHVQWGVMRSGPQRIPALVVGVKGSEGFFTHHRQPDLGSFCLQARGEMLLIDPGYYQGAADAHSLPIVDGRAPTISGARITDAWQHGPWRAMTVDSTRGYLGAVQRIRRTIAIYKARAVVILDDIVPAADGKGQVSSYYQCAHATNVDADARAAVVHGKKGKLHVRFFGPGVRLAIEQREFGKSWLYNNRAARGEFDWHRVQGRYVAAPDDPLLTVLQPVASDANAAAVEVERGRDRRTVRVAGLPAIRFGRTPAGWGLAVPKGCPKTRTVLASPPGWPEPSPRVATAARTARPPTVDGNFDDPAWGHCAPMRTFTDPYPGLFTKLMSLALAQTRSVV